MTYSPGGHLNRPPLNDSTVGTPQFFAMSDAHRQAEDKTLWGAWYGLAILFVAYTVSFIDRTILSMLVEPIKAALDLTDTEVSLLHGFAFAIFYTFLGIPIARLADYRSRKWIITCGVCVWSLMTAACGLAGRFSTLFLARVGVGVGEAALSPAAYSMISDMFPKRRLGVALSLYSAGVYVGAGLAFIVGGLAVQKMLAIGDVTIPFIGTTSPWQMIFFVVGLPGILVALLMATVTEPKREAARTSGHANGLLPVFRFIAAEPSAFLLHFIGYSLLGLIFNAFLAWAPAFFFRSYEMSPGDTGSLLGVLILLFGASGMIAGGMHTDRLRRAGDTAAPFTSSRLAGICATPICIAIPFFDSIEASTVLFGALFFFSAFPFGSAASAIQIATPPHMRAQMSAVYLFCLNLVGIGFGPTLVALLTDYLFQDVAMLGWSLAIVGGIAAPLGAIALHIGRQPLIAATARREREEHRDD